MTDQPMILEWVGAEKVIRPMTAEEIAANAPPPPPAPVLTPAQWGFFLDLSGFRDPLDMALDALPKTTMQERQTWAALRAIAHNSAEYRLDVTLALVGQVRGYGLPVDIPGDADIEAAFMAAAQFQGAASLIE